jgi:hypothetical protein
MKSNPKGNPKRKGSKPSEPHSCYIVENIDGGAATRTPDLGVMNPLKGFAIYSHLYTSN